MNHLRHTAFLLLNLSFLASFAAPREKAISPNLFGIFFEDLNYAADGGLYAEMVQNRSFEYQPSDIDTHKNPGGLYNPFTAWTVEKTHSLCHVTIESRCPLNANNTHYAQIEIVSPGDAGAGLGNTGYDGMVVRQGAVYNFSAFLRTTAAAMPVDVQLVAGDKQHTVLAAATFTASGDEWRRYDARLTATASSDSAKLRVLFRAEGTVAADMVSLFPQDTYKGRANGLRRDLAETIAALRPAFMRFPGGCLAHGDGIANIYDWKRTIGPVEQRREDSNIWNYRQSFGLGYYEYLLFCEDIGAKPLPVLAAGVSCQNSSRRRGDGQQAIPMERMGEYVQDVLDLIEYCNGPATSTWGKKRAEAGHPAPFHLEYVGVGNEDHITPEFEQRYALIVKAIRQHYPDIKIVGTAGPDWHGWDFEHGWAASRREAVDVVDEHYYCSPGFFLKNFHRYDAYPRTGPKVYLGEYASWGSTLYNALAEAAYMTQLERNGDVVEFASYAPLLARIGHTQWNPDMIYFDSRGVYPSVNYEVQRLFGEHRGTRYIGGVVGVADSVASSCVRAAGGDLIVKMVNYGSRSAEVKINLSGLGRLPAEAALVVLTGSKNAKNTRDKPATVVPQTSSIAAAKRMTRTLPPYSFTILRLKQQ